MKRAHSPNGGGGGGRQQGARGSLTHRLPLRLDILQVARKLGDDLRRQVLGDHLVLPGVIVEFVERRQEGPAERVPKQRSRR